MKSDVDAALLLNAVKADADTALATKQVAINATLPLSLSALGDLTLNSAGFAAAGASYTKARSDGAYQHKFIAYPPLSLTDTKMSTGGVDLIVPTLILDMTGYATTDDISTLQSAISAISLLQLSPYGELSIDLGAYQSKLSVSAPLVLTGNTLSNSLSSYVLASTLATTLANYLTASSLAPYALSSSLSAYATTASLSSYAQLAALSAYVPLSTLSQYQRTLTATAPLALSGTNVLSLDTTGFLSFTPGDGGNNIQLVQTNKIRCLNSGSHIAITEIAGVVNIGTFGLQPTISCKLPLQISNTNVLSIDLGVPTATQCLIPPGSDGEHALGRPRILPSKTQASQVLWC